MSYLGEAERGPFPTDNRWGSVASPSQSFAPRDDFSQENLGEGDL